ncbi:MAG: ankyrin repeat domain-containing protein [Candidatus Endonucleobacter bathymodioli]|uniref:Ankyrin repeat domain-containing protein n=1 Tax=Candidatus Endonucleibacter bathymodioli TaxID=539814 RepID=A0AA90NS86_9GAMM|nr:ankyrin repeat domain-containing protein [Candidatus Endonucleobacter bathymodioli]
MFLAWHKIMARPCHLIDLLLFFSIITGYYSESCCAAFSVDESNNTLPDSDAKHESSIYPDFSILRIVEEMDDRVILGAMQCLLNIAHRNKDDNLIHILMLSKAPHHESKQNDATALQCADLNNYYVIKFLRDNIISHAGTYESEEGLLSAAIPFDNNKLIELLVASGANINSHDINNNTPLHNAVRHGHLDIVKTLLTAGAEVDCLGSHTLLPNQNYELIQRGAYDSGEHISPLQTAIINRDTEIVNVLLDNKANPNDDECAFTPLLTALQVRSDPIVKALLAAGAAVDEIFKSPKYKAITSEHSTPQKLAVAKVSYELLKFLITADVNLHERYENGDSLLHIIAYRIDSSSIPAQRIVSIFELLIAEGVDVNSKNAKGLTPLLLIASKDYIYDKETVRSRALVCNMLLRNGADINAIDDKKGNTALHYAVKNGTRDLVLLLLANDANIGIKNNAGALVSTDGFASWDKIAEDISEAPFVTRERELPRLEDIVRIRIRKLIFEKIPANANPHFSKKVRTLPIPKPTHEFIINHP